MMSNEGSAGRGSPRMMSPQPLGTVMFQGLGTPPPLPPPPLPPPPPHHHLHHYVIHPHDMVRVGGTTIQFPTKESTSW